MAARAAILEAILRIMTSLRRSQALTGSTGFSRATFAVALTAKN